MNEQPPAYPLPGNPPPSDGLAVASLVCGIGSVTCFGVLSGLPAIICGHVSRGKIARSGGTLGGAGMALAGLIMGYVSLAYTALAFLIIIPAIALPFFVATQQSGKKLEAMNQCQQLHNALEAYANEYGKYPPVIANGEGEAYNNVVVAVLRGKDEGLNPRKVVFFETRETDILGGQLLDPWKRPVHFSFGAPDGVETDAAKARGTAEVWSSGPNGINEHGTGDDVVPQE